MTTFYINSNNPTASETLANIYDGADTDFYRNEINTHGLDHVAVTEFQNGFENWECTHEAEHDAINDREHDECAHTVKVTVEDIARAIADFCGLVEIELNGDSSQVLITETEEIIAANIFSEDPHEWETLEAAKLSKSGHRRVSNYNPFTGHAYAIEQ